MNTYAIEMFHDGACPLCAKEVRLFRKLDRNGSIRLTDIAAVDFQPAKYGKTMDEFMGALQGRLPSGKWVEGVEVFRQIYQSLGFARLVAFSRLSLIDAILQSAYRVFAAHRLRLTGRCTDACELPSGHSGKHPR